MSTETQMQLTYSVNQLLFCPLIRSVTWQMTKRCYIHAQVSCLHLSPENNVTSALHTSLCDWMTSCALCKGKKESEVVILVSGCLRVLCWRVFCPDIHRLNLPKSVCRLAGCQVAYVYYHFLYGVWIRRAQTWMSWIQVAKLLVPRIHSDYMLNRKLTVCHSFVMVMVTHYDRLYISVAFHVFWMVFAFVSNAGNSESSSQETSHPGTRSQTLLPPI